MYEYRQEFASFCCGCHSQLAWLPLAQQYGSSVNMTCGAALCL